MTDLWHFVNKWPGECTAEVSRRGEFQPCDKPAYAVAKGFDPEGYWPVCIHHARGKALVTLAEILEAHR